MFVCICVHVEELRMVEIVATGTPFEPEYLNAEGLTLGFRLKASSHMTLQEKINKLLDAIAGLIGKASFMAHPI